MYMKKVLKIRNSQSSAYMVHRHPIREICRHIITYTHTPTLYSRANTQLQLPLPAPGSRPGPTDDLIDQAGCCMNLYRLCSLLHIGCWIWMSYISFVPYHHALYFFALNLTLDLCKLIVVHPKKEHDATTSLLSRFSQSHLVNYVWAWVSGPEA